MLSNFGRADGGRETWAYNFIPRLLERYPSLRLRIYGLRVDGEPDNSETVLSAAPRAQRNRLSVEFVRAKADRWPNALAFWNGVSKLSHHGPSPAFVLAVGSWVELRAALLTPAFRSAGKLVWLRSIFADEKAHRYPTILRPWLKRIEMAVLRRADVVIANGEDTAEHYRKLGLKVCVVPNGVDLDRWRMKPAHNGEQVDVAYVGRLAPVKGIDDFVQVASEARRRHLDGLRFHVIGDGPSLADVGQAAAEGLLQYHGAVPNEQMPQLLSQMQACVALTYVRSKDEKFSGGSGLSNALLEQMAAGRVIVAWDNAAFRQVLDERSAFFVRQGDRKALLDALIQIRANPSAAAARAANGAAVAENYGFDYHLGLFEDAAAQWLRKE
jgi:glycosyltransferase involved in cell wall biosynthesis